MRKRYSNNVTILCCGKLLSVIFVFSQARTCSMK